MYHYGYTVTSLFGRLTRLLPERNWAELENSHKVVFVLKIFTSDNRRYCSKVQKFAETERELHKDCESIVPVTGLL